MEEQTQMQTEKTRSGGHAALWILVLALIAGNIYAVWQIGQTKDQVAKLDESLQARFTSMTAQTSAWNSRADERVAELQRQLDDARAQASTAAGRAKTQAERRAEQLVKELSEEYRKQSTQFSDELGQVRQNATATDEKVNSVAGDVTQTRSDLEAAIGDLKSVRGDLGVQSGLIATNAKELAALRELGERHYFEFDISKKGDPQRVGNVSLVLRKTFPKQGKFTMDVVADDRTVQKKDRTINEPIQFYAGGYRTPYEIVVNDVKKDRIVGYLSAPKVQAASR
ncbi:MAG: hypothetical protein KIT09_02350 [Bryobacteraceae bacterium]|nr:hypothetical protein [Bryobacteraceae bacterium]